MPEDCWEVEPNWEGIHAGEVSFIGSGKLDYDKIEKHRERVIAGRRLFADHFQSLWI